jgi:hypothetical protein
MKVFPLEVHVVHKGPHCRHVHKAMNGEKRLGWEEVIHGEEKREDTKWEEAIDVREERGREEGTCKHTHILSICEERHYKVEK